MHGLTIRWSLLGVPAGAEDELRAYVRDTSVPRFTGMQGLLQKTWQMAPGGFFSGVYVWATEQARADFLEHFRSNPSPVTRIVGNDPDVVQTWELIGVAIGADGPLPS